MAARLILSEIYYIMGQFLLSQEINIDWLFTCPTDTQKNSDQIRRNSSRIRRRRSGDNITIEVRPLRSEADYAAALEAIEAFSRRSRSPALPRPIVSICLRSSSPITSPSIGPSKRRSPRTCCAPGWSRKRCGRRTSRSSWDQKRARRRSSIAVGISPSSGRGNSTWSGDCLPTR